MATTNRMYVRDVRNAPLQKTPGQCENVATHSLFVLPFTPQLSEPVSGKNCIPESESKVAPNAQRRNNVRRRRNASR